MVKLALYAFGPRLAEIGVAALPGGGAEMAEVEMVGALSMLTPTSPRIYQFEPISTTVGALAAGASSIGGSAVPKRSAAAAGVAASAIAAIAAAESLFIGF